MSDSDRKNPSLSLHRNFFSISGLSIKSDEKKKFSKILKSTFPEPPLVNTLFIFNYFSIFLPYHGKRCHIFGKNSDDLCLATIFFPIRTLKVRASSLYCLLGGRTHIICTFLNISSQKLVDRGKITPQGNHLVIPLSNIHTVQLQDTPL